MSFFSAKLSPAEQKYSAFDRELLAIYRSIKHFQHLLEGRQFTIFTDHKPLIFAFSNNSNSYTAKQIRYLSFVSEFTTDIRHISGRDNVVADALFRVELVEEGLDFEALAASQSSDSELQALMRSDSGLVFKQVTVPGSNAKIWCDVSINLVRPFLTVPFRRIVFNFLHGLSHPGINATVKNVFQRYVWPSVKSDCREWARSCIPCQQNKVNRHISAPLGSFMSPSKRFEQVHLDLVILPASEGYRYCLTCIDRFTRWPEAFPLRDQEAVTVARAFYEGWICRFGVPLRVTTDQGRQFESHLFKQLNALLGSTHLHTTAYHPAANGMVERFHRQLKAAIRCHQNNRWTEVLPTILLGVRSAWKEDLKSTSADLVYGESLRLPGEFLSPSSADCDYAIFVKELRNHFHNIGPTAGSRHGNQRVFMYKDLDKCKFVFLRCDAAKAILQAPYNRPYEVISRNPKTLTIKVDGKIRVVSIDRVKPAYIVTENIEVPSEYEQVIPLQIAAPSVTETLPAARDVPAETRQHAIPPVPSRNSAPFVTKSGRRVRFPDRFQAGFS